MVLRPFPCFLLAPILLVTLCSSGPIFKKYRAVYKVGDQQEWATKNWNDQDWQSGKLWMEDGTVFWFRARIDILEAPEPFHPYGIQLDVYGEYEVYWDGVMIGKNGNPGQEELLPPEGKLWATFSIPTELTNEGEHLLAVRSSLHYFPDHAGIFGLDIDYYDELLTEGLIQASFMHIFAGAFLIASFYFLFLFLGNKKEYSTLIFSIGCFLFFVLILTEFIKAYVPIHYSLHVVRLQIIGFLMFGISFLIPFYFSMHFPLPNRKVYLTAYAAMLLLIFLMFYRFYDFTAYNMAICMWFFSLIIVLFGVYKKIRGALLVLLTLFLCALIDIVTSFDISLFAGFGLILLSMFYLLSLRIHDQRLAYENSLVQSTRLRLELLKKNIQPHFLMNTLTSLIDWVEESPKKGVLFIEELAKEFDLFNQIENQTLIPIAQEIELCRTHLEIMEYRKEITYSWEEEGIDFEQQIPPAILHTLLENGITHSIPRDDNSIRFKLVFESNTHYKCYTFLTFAGSVRKPMTDKKEGTGIKYIKARLDESYPSKWDFTSEATAHGWENSIKIYS